MPEEGFLRRWARVKATGDDAAPESPRAPAPPAPREPMPAPSPGRWARAGDVPPPADAPASSAATIDPAAAADLSSADTRPSPTLEDVAELTLDSDYSIFVGQGVDKSVQRLALKKLFADPHFNVMDRLDMYMDDYNIPSPVSEAMLAQLDHARSALRRFVEDDPAPAAPDGTPAPDAIGPEAVPSNEAVPHNEAAHGSAAHEDPPPGDSSGDGTYLAPTQDHGPFHRPNQQLPQGQA